MNYRFDVRTKNQFIKDIKENSIKEIEIAIRLCVDFYKKNKKWPNLTPNGVDCSGSFIEDNRKINSNPDFVIDNEVVEITHSNFLVKKFFHQKENKVIKLLKNKQNLVFVNGLLEKEPQFIWLSYKQLEHFTDISLKKYDLVSHPCKNGRLINKTAYRYDVDWFNGLWQILPKITKDIPKSYVDVLKLTEV